MSKLTRRLLFGLPLFGFLPFVGKAKAQSLAPPATKWLLVTEWGGNTIWINTSRVTAICNSGTSYTRIVVDGAWISVRSESIEALREHLDLPGEVVES